MEWKVWSRVRVRVRQTTTTINNRKISTDQVFLQSFLFFLYSALCCSCVCVCVSSSSSISCSSSSSSSNNNNVVLVGDCVPSCIIIRIIRIRIRTSIRVRYR
mmetsp:Transcript_41751/g.48192  ORF Transcript_41751/g.48192 Transcript_41751/m.48192 type:complete len:102 (+) Transcript_41751:214-519(+)